MSALRRCGALAATAAATALLAGSFAGAYSFTCGSHASGIGGFLLNPNFRDAAAGSDAQQVAAFTRAGNEWTTRGGARFAWAYGGETGIDYVDLDDSVNACFSRNESSGSTLAFVICAMSGSRLAFDMVFYDGWTWNDDASDGTGGYDIQGIATHELGHALGLGHSNVSGSTMWPSSLGNGVANRSIEADDIAGIRALYGVPTPPAPSTLDPAEGGLAGGTQVTVLGAGFDSTTRVFFDGAEAEVLWVIPPGEIRVATPPSPATGPADVLFSNLFGGSATLPSAFEYTPNDVHIDIVSGVPSPGETVTLRLTGPVNARWAAAQGSDGTPSSKRGIDFCFDVRRATLIGSSLGAGSDPRLDAQGSVLVDAVIPPDAEIFSFVYFQAVVQVGPNLVPTGCLVLSVLP